MTIASPPIRWRRVLAICVASALLHYLAAGWVGARLGASFGAAEPEPPVSPSVMVAQLRLSVPPPPAALPPAAVRPGTASKRPALPVPATIAAPGPGASTLPLAADLPALATLADTDAPDVGAGDGGQSLAFDAEHEASADAPAPAPAAVLHKVALPPSADLTMDVNRVDADGTKWSGLMTMSWKRSGNRYALRSEATISMLITRVSLALLTSEGVIDDSGIAPRLATEKRRGKAQTATHFKADEKLITFSASERSYPLLPGAQDKATFPIQLAGIARADSAQLSAGVDMLVGDDKDATTFNFAVVGREQIDTGMGTLDTWHLSRPPRPGSYNSRLDVWLAPAHNWYPVQLRNTEAKGAVTTQTIRKIVLTD